MILLNRTKGRLRELHNQAMRGVYFPASSMQLMFAPMSVKTMVTVDGWLFELMESRKDAA